MVLGLNVAFALILNVKFSRNFTYFCNSHRQGRQKCAKPDVLTFHRHRNQHRLRLPEQTLQKIANYGINFVGMHTFGKRVNKNLTQIAFAFVCCNRKKSAFGHSS